MTQVQLSAEKVAISGKAKDDDFYIFSANKHQEVDTDLQ